MENIIYFSYILTFPLKLKVKDFGRLSLKIENRFKILNAVEVDVGSK
jgi:hypothetical protein